MTRLSDTVLWYHSQSCTKIVHILIRLGTEFEENIIMIFRLQNLNMQLFVSVEHVFRCFIIFFSLFLASTNIWVQGILKYRSN